MADFKIVQKGRASVVCRRNIRVIRGIMCTTNHLAAEGEYTGGDIDTDKLVADRDKNFEEAEAKLRAYIQEHEELKTCRAGWEEMEREKRHELYWIPLYTDDKEDAEIEWLVAYDMDEGQIRQDKIM